MTASEFIFTIIGGTATYTLGQFILKGCLEPAVELKKVIAKIAHDLDFYANKMQAPTCIEHDVSNVFRTHYCQLREKLNAMIWYSILKVPLSLPDQNSIATACSELIGHSNFQTQTSESRAPRIRELLNIK